MNLLELIQSMLNLGGKVLFRNQYGTVELVGKDLTLKGGQSNWFTIFHKEAKNIEKRTHIHLKKDTFSFAKIIRPQEKTPQLSFWPSKEDFSEETKPQFSILFPSFFKWDPDKEAIPESRDIFEMWIKENGEEFNLVAQ